MPEALSDIAIQRELGTLDGWARRGSALTKTYQFRTFADAISFVNHVAGIAESANHHPDLDIRYNKVICNLTSHDAGGITERDFRLARAIDSAGDPGEEGGR